MNRRQFTTSLSTLFAAPALPLKALTAAPASGTAVPNAARFWAIYMSQMHGTCTAHTLSTMTGIDASTAQGYLSRMIGDGVIKPTNIVSKAIDMQNKASKSPSQWKERMKKIADERAPAPQSGGTESDLVETTQPEEQQTEVSK